MLSRGWTVAWLLVLLGVGFTVSASDSNVPIDWDAIPPLSLPRHSGAAVVVDGLVYAIGGIEYGNSIAFYGQSYDVTTGTMVEVYDPDAGTWTRLSDLPYPIDMMARRAEGRMWLAAAAHGGKIYAFGGANLNDEVRDTIDAYDIATDTWTAGIARLPAPVCGLSAATVGDTIYLFGGARSTDPYSPQDYVSDCYAFDPATRSVAPIASMPVARFKTNAIPAEDGVLVLGGISAASSANAQIYHPGTDTWDRLEPVFWERRFWGGAKIEGAMFLIGGRDEHAVSSGAVDVWIPKQAAWAIGDPMSTPREDAFTAAARGALYVLGGRNHEGTPFADAERGTPDLASAIYVPSPEVEPLVAIEWSVGAPMPTPRYFGATAVVDGSIYAIGGLEESDPTARAVDIYDPATDTWTAGPPLPEGRFNMAAAVLDGVVYVFGGADAAGVVRDSIYAFDPSSSEWRTLGVLPHAVAGIAAVTHDGRIYLFGGSHSSQMYVPKENYYDEVYAFDPTTLTFEPLPPMPVARNMAFAGAVGDDVYVIGGMKSPGATACQRYDPPIRTWTIMAEMPAPRGGHGGAVIRTTPTRGVYVLGGANRIDVYGYDWGEDRWFVATSIPAPRNLSFTAVVARSPERIYLIGGTDETGSVVGTVFIGRFVDGATSE